MSAISPLAQAVLNALDDGVAVFDSEGRMLFANDAASRELASMGSDAPTGSNDLLARLAANGARVALIRVDEATVGTAVYLKPNETGRHTLADRERDAILETLRAADWKLAESARRLGISRTTLWRRLKEYGLHRDGRGKWSPAS